MRSFLVSACALLILCGCGRNSQEPPQAAINSGPNGTDPPAKKEGPPEADKGAGASKKAQIAQAGQQNPPTAGGPGFAADDAEQTLRWLIRSAAKVRSTPPGDKSAVDREWKDYTRVIKTAHGQKIRWELRVRDADTAGVGMEEVKSPADADCAGLRVKPAQQPDDGGESFILEVPGGPKGAGLSPGTRALVTGVITRIDTSLRKSPHLTPYEFGIRLKDYTVTPMK